MKKIGLLLLFFSFLLFAGKNTAQSLTCNDLVYVSLDENCSYVLQPSDILEGNILLNCIVELDKVPPYGNGPWSPGVLGPNDIGKTYQVRVRHLPSGNACWGNVTTEDKLPPKLSCDNVSVVTLNGSAANVIASQLSITATDACSVVTLTPGSFSFDCSDLGLSSVQLTATDASGNSATCSHTVLVTSPNACSLCVANCPESVVVSYDTGNNLLLPAFQNSDWSAFDPYGNALFDGACSYVDSIYVVNYQTGTAGQNWFVRQWTWLDGGGQPFNCEQYIVFPTTYTATVQGKVYIDTDDDCISDATEQGTSFYSLKLTKLPSGTFEIITPGANGQYTASITFGPQDNAAELQLLLPVGYNPVCPSALNIPNNPSTPTYQFDIGLQSNGDCPQMQVDLGSNSARRCLNNLMNIQYCNNGLDTAFGAFVTLNLDPLVQLVSSEIPYTVAGADSIYTFQLGNVPPFTCGSIALIAKYSCNAMLGQTICNEANIYPDVPCSGAWQGPALSASAQCSGDSVSLTLKNYGQQNMSTTLDYIVVEDFIMYKQAPFQLDAGDSITIKTASNGSTWRIEAPQVPGFPFSNLAAAAIEGCGGINTPGVLNIYGSNNSPLTYDEDCVVVTGSYDPNDKTAVPVGYTDQHIIRANQSIDYKIRFQNTGTDTAFRVLVVDTLSALLDERTLEVGASSHPYHLNIYPGGILHFVFDPIALPDSNVNEAASHGYLSFRIAQKADLPDGTRIENTAAIYFDQNDPVITNTAFHTVGYPFVPNPPVTYSAQATQPSCHGASDGALQLTVTGGVPPYTFLWSEPGLQGESLSGLQAGLYQVTFTDSYRAEFVQTFELTDPAPITLTLSATPATGNDNNGTASVTATGGTGAISYLWSNGATTASLTGLAAGTYTVVATDVRGCTQSNTVEVTQTILPLLLSAQIASPKCFGAADGAISVTVSGGLAPYTFQWSDPNLQGANLSGLSAGNYHLTLTDNNGGELVQSFELNNPDPLVLTMSATDAIGNLNDGTATVAASGGTGALTYLWNNNESTESISGLAPGIYSVTATDANGCTQSNTVEVSQIIFPLVYSALLTNPKCFDSADGAISVTVSGGLTPYTFQWSNPNAQGDHPSGLLAGNYDLTLTDNAGQQEFASFVLTAPTPVTLTLSATPTIGNQQNGTATALASGGAGNYSYLWNNGATTATISGLSAGVYTLEVTDENGCTQSASVEVQQLVSTTLPDARAQIKVWPNPAHEQITLDLKPIWPTLLRLDLLSADGRVLRQLYQHELPEHLTLHLGEESARGFVLLVLHTLDGKVIAEKVMLY